MNAPVSPAPRTRHDGRMAELAGLMLINLVLQVLTLGVYHFWAKTRVRQYLWSHTEVDGERFLYTGRGLELLVGYLIGLVLLLVLSGLLGGLANWVQRQGPLALLSGVIGALGLVWLTSAAYYAGWRYRLGRTLWRGIRFGLRGSALAYGAQVARQAPLLVLSLGFYYPFLRNHLVSWAANRAAFGSVPATYQGRGQDLLPRFALTAGLTLVLAAVLLLSLGALFPYMAWFGDMPREVVLRRWPLLVLLPVLGVAALALAVLWLWLSYRAVELRYMIEHTSLGPLRFELIFPTHAYVRLWLGNALLLGLTLGTGLPLVVLRNARFLCAHLRISGQLDLEAVLQSSQQVAGTAEGLADALDLAGW